MELTANRGVAAPPATDASEADRRLLEALEPGLALVPAPYAALGARIGMSEADVTARLAALQERGVIRRFGVIVRHRALGYRANAMAVWDVPDAQAPAFGARLAAQPGVTLCYRRARSLPAWRYNLYCMIHGRDRTAVAARIAGLIRTCGLAGFPHAVLFSRRCFKQSGARYRGPGPDGGQGRGRG